MNIGILAHVDAGKTTITEQMLHICGITKEVGRVDNGNATTDAMALEKSRGITIRQTTVTMKYKDKVINLLDTPGHVDFIAKLPEPINEDGLSAVVFKIDRDSSGYCRCFTKIFGGTLRLRENYPVEGEDEPFKVLKMDALHGIKPYRRDVAMAGEVVILYTDRLCVGSVIGESPKGRRRLNIASPTLKAKVSCDDLAMRQSVCDALVCFVYSEFNSVDSTPSDYRKLSEEVVGLALGVSGTIQLEPIYRFEHWLPSVYVGRAIADVLKMRGTFEDPVMDGDMSILRGRVPQATSQYYEVDLADYTGGKGIISFQPDGYELRVQPGSSQDFPFSRFL